MIKNFEKHILFFVIVIFTSVHLYFILHLYLAGYDRFVEIWYAIYHFLGFLIFQ
jgi:hypothetical protein